jgi:hypothetical protein
LDGWIELAAAVAPRAYEKLKKVLAEKDTDPGKVSVLISMMIYDQGEKVLGRLERTDGKIEALQESVDDGGEAVQKVLKAVRSRR